MEQTLTIEPPKTAAPEPKPQPQSLTDRFSQLANLPTGALPGEAKLPAAAPVVEPPKAADAPGEPDEVPKEIKSDAAKANWKTLREKAKRADELETNLTTLKTELEKLKSTPKNDAELETVRKSLEAIQKERDEYSEKLRVADVVNHPKFKSYFEKKETEVTAVLSDSVGAERSTAIAKILAMPEGEYKNNALRDAMDGLDEFQQDEVKEARRKMREISREKTTEISRARESFEKMQAEEKATTENRAKQAKSQSESAMKEILAAAKSFESFKPKEGDKAHNDFVAERENYVKRYFTGELDQKEFAIAPLLAMDGLHARQVEIPTMQATIDQLQKELASLKAAKPGLGGTDPGSATISEKASMTDRIVAQAFNSGAIRKV